MAVSESPSTATSIAINHIHIDFGLRNGPSYKDKPGVEASTDAMPHSTGDGHTAATDGLSLRPKEQQEQQQLSEVDPRAKRLKIKNRRKHYLDLHPNYFKGSELELADPLLYDRLVRRFLSTEDREKEGRERGYTGILEADLVRSEAKVEALQNPDPNSPLVYRRADDGSIVGVEQDEDERAQGKEDGWDRWTDVMGQRFLRGDDHDFDYSAVDENEEYDDRAEEERTKLEQYLEDQEAEFLGDGTPKGETGVQDF